VMLCVCVPLTAIILTTMLCYVIYACLEKRRKDLESTRFVPNRNV